jgi:hypothetical protein
MGILERPAPVFPPSRRYQFDGLANPFVRLNAGAAQIVKAP